MGNDKREKGIRRSKTWLLFGACIAWGSKPVRRCSLETHGYRGCGAWWPRRYWGCDRRTPKACFWASFSPSVLVLEGSFKVFRTYCVPSLPDCLLTSSLLSLPCHPSVHLRFLPSSSLHFPPEIHQGDQSTQSSYQTYYTRVLPFGCFGRE